MSTLYAEALYYLEKYDRELDAIEPLSMYEIVVEALQDPAVANKEKQNQEHMKKSDSFIVSFFKKILTLFKKLITSIGDFVRLAFMSKDERARYEEMKRRVASDPKVKSKKITVSDFRKLENEYRSVENELNSKIKVGSGDLTELKTKINDLIKKPAKAYASVIGPELALRLASSNIEIAKGIQSILQKDTSILSTMENEVGKREAKKFERQINNAANRDTSWLSHAYMLKYELFHGKARTLEDCVKQIFSELESACGMNGKVEQAKAIASNTGLLSRAGKNKVVRDQVVSGTKAYLKGKNEARKRDKAIAKKQRLGGEDYMTGDGLYSKVSTWAGSKK